MHEEKRQLARSKYRWEDNITLVCKEASCNTLICILVDHNNSRVDLVNAGIILNGL